MKTRRTAVIACSLFAGIALGQVNLPQPGLPGSSPTEAVRIMVTNEIMADRTIKRWLRTHYPGWDADPIEFTDIGLERYAVVRIKSDNNPSRRVYFRLQSRHDDPTDDGPSFPQ